MNKKVATKKVSKKKAATKAANDPAPCSVKIQRTRGAEMPEYEGVTISLKAILPRRVALQNGARLRIETGIAAELPGGMIGMVLPATSGLSLADTIKIVETPSEVILDIVNGSPEVMWINPGDVVAQMIFLTVERPEIK